VECSSYQIDLSPTLDPSVGILLNLTPDHIDRHGTFARYAAIKERLVAGSRTAIVGVDDEHCAAIADRAGKPWRPEGDPHLDRAELADGLFPRRQR
jgi:UDP-N-acetylmuramoylalanine--D-glutamate ligase